MLRLWRVKWKPCVIGTRAATRVLRDGDRIEVDAANGMIKVLAA